VDQLLAEEGVRLQGSEGTLWQLTDNLGSVRDLAEYDEASGTTSVVNHITYDSFGNVTSETAAVDHLFGYTGRAYDEETDLQNNHNRWYDAASGRWLSEDPIGFDGGDANLYRYVGNNATGATDPSGLWEVQGKTLQKVYKSLKVRFEKENNYGDHLGVLHVSGGNGTSKKTENGWCVKYTNKMELSVQHTIDLPELSASVIKQITNGTSTEKKIGNFEEIWGKFYSAMKEHEEGHRQVADKFIEDYNNNESLRNDERKQASSVACNTIEDSAFDEAKKQGDSKIDEFLEKYKKKLDAAQEVFHSTNGTGPKTILLSGTWIGVDIVNKETDEVTQYRFR